jgi:hypothetical protein
MKPNHKNNLLTILAVVSLLAGCSPKDKLADDCSKFDKGFLEACNKNCPSKCTEVGLATKKINLPKEKIEAICKESCAKHCATQLENVKPTQCKAKK